MHLVHPSHGFVMLFADGKIVGDVNPPDHQDLAVLLDLADDLRGELLFC